MEILVFGAGSLGSLVGGLLARVHDVTLVGRDPHVSQVRADGLSVTGAAAARVAPDATTDGEGRTADLAVVTVKSFDTAAAAETLATGEFDAVLSLQNGLTEETLASRLDTTVLAGTATYGAHLREPGRVACTGVGRVVLGARTGGSDPAAERVGKAFRDAGLRTLVATDMPRRRWEKLAVNAGINAVTALARVENGSLADGPAAEVAHRAARETVRVARAEGVPLTYRGARAALVEVVSDTAENRSSMLQDVDAGRRTEVEAIHGEVVERADRHGIDAPTNRTLAGLLRAWEAGRGVR
ncbi:ketopantoate reductase family protein [Halopelagius longus]|uniref:2-dehydropantoate 2-reductase n=1 Tax=Halopelagius longus TaxID=1236180 RepID=A0A1H1EKJ9_9EURY|nr:ketopantoate reductase family protein [Halopelagius longus]RDI71789.1 ketopantoate reductase family protein [Halopelagius longus]SDQ89100.1 ketopantoate reductase [Halopelagius longus]